MSVTGRKKSTKKEDRKQERRSEDAVSLLLSYQRAPTPRNAGRIIERFRSLVEKAVGSYKGRIPPTVDPQDLIQAGMFGLIVAARRYDSERGVPFSFFCQCRIRGAIQDELRSLDWMPRSNGTGREKARQCMFLAGDLGDERDGDFLDGFVDCKEGESVLEMLHREELLVKIKRSLTTLEWRILHDSYIRGKTLKQVADRLSISSSHVCNLRARIIDKLRRWDEEDGLADNTQTANKDEQHDRVSL